MKEKFFTVFLKGFQLLKIVSDLTVHFYYLPEFSRQRQVLCEICAAAYTQLTFACSESTIKALEKYVKYVQS